MSPCPKARHRQLNGCMTGTNWLIGLRLCMHAPCMHNVYIEVDAVTTAATAAVMKSNIKLKRRSRAQKKNVVMSKMR